MTAYPLARHKGYLLATPGGSEREWSVAAATDWGFLHWPPFCSTDRGSRLRDGMCLRCGGQIERRQAGGGSRSRGVVPTAPPVGALLHLLHKAMELQAQSNRSCSDGAREPVAASS